jgi:Uma2 family endonuclease
VGSPVGVCLRALPFAYEKCATFNVYLLNSKRAMETPTKLSPAEVEYRETHDDKPMPSVNHSGVQLRIGAALLLQSEEHTPFSELSLDLNGWRTTPDLSVYPKMELDFENDRVRMTEPPLLAVEIQSPTQSTEPLVKQARMLLAAGVRSVWLVQPAVQTVTRYAEGAPPHVVTLADGTLDDPATGFTLDLAALFR